MRMSLSLCVAILAAGCSGNYSGTVDSSGGIPGLIKQLDVGDEPTRANAAEALGDLGPAAKTAIPSLVLAMRDEAEAVREQATLALVEIGADEGAVPALTGAVQDSDAVVRAGAASALGGIGSGARSAVPALIEALKDHDPSVKCAAADALRRIDQAAAVKAGVN
jgi:HEAT repeat protein